MEFLVCDGNHSISGIHRSGSVGDYTIQWDSKGIDDFLILTAKKKSDVVFSENDNLKQLIQNKKSALMEYGSIEANLATVQLQLITFAEYCKIGGSRVNGRPGMYAIYGIDVKSDKIYIPKMENTIQIRMELRVTQQPIYREVGILKKRKEYTGYRKIEIDSGVPSIGKGEVYYTIPDDPSYSKYPIPHQILCNPKGGHFFVKCSESLELQFGTTNREEIAIR